MDNNNNTRPESDEPKVFKPSDYIDEDTRDTAACCIHANAVGQVAVLESLGMPELYANSLVIGELTRTTLGLYVHLSMSTGRPIKIDQLVEDIKTIMLKEVSDRGFVYDPETGIAEEGEDS